MPFSDDERIAASWPIARLVPVEGLGHRRILRDDAVLQAVDRFLVGRGRTQAALSNRSGL